MIGIILLAITWLLLRLEHKGLNEIGLNKPTQRSIEFIVGLILAALFCFAQNGLLALAGNFSWELNPQYSFNTALDSLRWILNSVLYEELLFRGYLLYKAIHYLGPKAACIVSAVAFGVYHWFTYEVIGNPVAMGYVFILTAIPGFMFSYAFLKTRSIILPIGLHLGWNIFNILVFSKGPVGEQLLLTNPALTTESIDGWSALFINLIIPLLLPLVVILFLKFSSQYNKQ
ncbi:CPBP family intramembrane glutamic endopeptidase [Kangiella marina]|uniref:CAAX prenyl protease 2/Lysostaphin resistance protein A-like domain-containing protein n=1 Tax=Kangiella marina TaxID=1079178 RepID=A0ABP8IL01_9GAMM